MASKYSIIQYVPNPVADERINIGAIAFSNSDIKVKFLSNWDRVRLFGMEDITFLQEFADKMSESVKAGLLYPGDRDDGRSRYERLTKVVDSWMNSIQFTKISNYLDTVENVLEDITKTHLIEPAVVSNKTVIFNFDKDYDIKYSYEKITEIVQMHRSRPPIYFGIIRSYHDWHERTMGAAVIPGHIQSMKKNSRIWMKDSYMARFVDISFQPIDDISDVDLLDCLQDGAENCSTD